jgi:DNA-binding response OmpR family regulator
MTQSESAATILLVEDAPDLAQVLARELEASGYRVLRAAGGRAALDLHARARPDLVVLDWMLPGLDGLEVVRRLRQVPGPGAATPVLMLTARGEEADRVLGLEVGADDYLTKPFSVRELLARVRALLRRDALLRRRRAADREDDQAPVAYGPLALDPERHTAVQGGRPLDLTPHEFALMHLLLRRPGRAFSRSYLLDTVWGEAYVGGDRSVDNTVLRLRKKLGPLGDAVETVWGVGYRLRPADRAAATSPEYGA